MATGDVELAYKGSRALGEVVGRRPGACKDRGRAADWTGAAAQALLRR